MLERILCPAVSGFDITPSGTSVNVPCGEHFYGNMTGFCSWYGAWIDVDVSACIAIPTCPEDGIWPRTNINTEREISCGVGVMVLELDSVMLMGFGVQLMNLHVVRTGDPIDD